MFNSDVIKGYLAGLLRIVLGSALTYAIAKGYLTDESAGQLVLIIAGALVVLGTSLFSKIRADNKVTVALTLPADSSKAKLEDVIASKNKDSYAR